MPGEVGAWKPALHAALLILSHVALLFVFGLLGILQLRLALNQNAFWFVTSKVSQTGKKQRASLSFARFERCCMEQTSWNLSLSYQLLCLQTIPPFDGSFPRNDFQPGIKNGVSGLVASTGLLTSPISERHSCPMLSRRCPGAVHYAVLRCATLISQDVPGSVQALRQALGRGSAPWCWGKIHLMLSSRIFEMLKWWITNYQLWLPKSLRKSHASSYFIILHHTSYFILFPCLPLVGTAGDLQSAMWSSQTLGVVGPPVMSRVTEHHWTWKDVKCWSRAGNYFYLQRWCVMRSEA